MVVTLLLAILVDNSLNWARATLLLSGIDPALHPTPVNTHCAGVGKVSPDLTCPTV